MIEATKRQVEVYTNPIGLEPFQLWLDELSDRRAQLLIDKTIAKIRLGNLGKHKSVGEGVQEIKLDYGAGFRLYFAEHGNALVILLCGSTKRDQQKAIEMAQKYWKDWKERSRK